MSNKIEQIVEDELDQQMMDNCGFVYCPCCGIHLENGISQHDPDEVDWEGKRPYMNDKYLYACLGCGGEFGPELEVAVKKAPKKTGKAHPKDMTLRAKCFADFKDGFMSVADVASKYEITYGNAHYYFRAFNKSIKKGV